MCNRLVKTAPSFKEKLALMATFPLSYVLLFLVPPILLVKQRWRSWLAVVLLGLTTQIALADKLYIANSHDNTVSVVDTDTNSIIATIPVWETPTSVTVTPDGTRVYVGHSDTRTVSIIDTRTNSVITTVELLMSGSVFALAVNPSGTHVYVPNFDYGSTNSDPVKISRIDTSTNQVEMNSISLSYPTSPVKRSARYYPIDVAFNPSGTRAYMYIESEAWENPSFYADIPFVVIDTNTNEALSTVWLPGTECGFATGGSVVINPSGTLVYVAKTYNSDSNIVNVSVIDTNTNSIVATIPLDEYSGGQGETFDMVINRSGSHIYVTSNNFVSVIDTSTNKVVSTLPVNRPRNVAMNSSGTRLYVTGDDGVSVIDTSNNSVLATVPVGKYPFGIAVVASIDKVEDKIVTDGGDKASYIAIWQLVNGDIMYVDTVSVEDFDAKFQEHRDYEVVNSNGEYLLKGIDDGGNITSEIQVVRIQR